MSPAEELTTEQMACDDAHQNDDEEGEEHPDQRDRRRLVEAGDQEFQDAWQDQVVEPHNDRPDRPDRDAQRRKRQDARDEIAPERLANSSEQTTPHRDTWGLLGHIGWLGWLRTARLRRASSRMF